MNNNILSVLNLTKNFKSSFFSFKKETECIKNISFDLNYGQSLCLFGPNGAGKTTIIHMLLDVLTPTKGQIKYFGKELTKHRSEILNDIAFASTYSKLPGKLSVKQNLEIHGRLYNMSQQVIAQEIERYLTIFNMLEFKNKITANLSSGQLAKIMLIKAFITKPQIVILDEPTAALDTETANLVRNFIKQEISKRNISVILASHNIEEITTLCDKVLLLKKGELKNIIDCQVECDKETARIKLEQFINNH